MIENTSFCVECYERIDKENEGEYTDEVACSCPFYERTCTDGDIANGSVIPCVRCYKCFVGECGHFACECSFH